MQVSNSFFDVLRQYLTDCTFLPLFVLVFIWIVKKWNKDRKKALFAVGCASLLVFNELVYRIFVIVGEGSTYYRMFWIIPVSLVLAAGFVECITKLSKIKTVVAFIVAWIACIFLSGKSGVEWFKLPENVYQIDEDVIQVSEALMELTNGQRTYLLDDGSISNTVRQYNPKVMNTNAEYFLLDRILQERNTNALGSVVQDSVKENHSRYVAVQKAKSNVYKVFESGGLKLANETDNYRIYYVDYGRLDDDYNERKELETGLWNRVTHEYILIPEFEQEIEYIYVTDFGDVNNKQVYEEVFKKLRDTDAKGIIINHKFSENREWVEQYKEELMQLGIPCYYNDSSIQVIEQQGIIFCLLDNSIEVTEEQLEELLVVLEHKKPVVLVCTKRLVWETDSKLVTLITKENSPVVQVLSSMQDGFKKDMLSDNVLQYAAPVDNKQHINILRVESLEPKEIIQY